MESMDGGRYIQLVDAHITGEEGSDDLFDFDVFVVTVKTEGRSYGVISQQLRARYPEVQIPVLGWGLSSPPIALHDGKQVIFTCLWKDEEQGEGYPNHVVRSCTASAIRQATDAGCEELAMPLIGGGKKFSRKAAMGQGLHDAFELIDRRGQEAPELYIVVGRKRPPRVRGE